MGQADEKLRAFAISGNVLDLDATKVDEIVVALEQRGYRCTEDTGLVERALGMSTPPN